MLYFYFKKVIKYLIPKRLFPVIEKPLRYFFSLLYIGSNVACPVCGGNFRRFIKLDKQDPESDLLCPRCGSGRRQRLLWLFLENEVGIASGELNILHFSPLSCLVTKLKSLKNINYITSDFEDTMADRNYDITDIDEKDDSFDMVICYHVLEHVADDRKAMQELFRILKPNGCAILQVPWKGQDTFEDSDIVLPEERKEAFGQEDHVRIYSLNDFVNRLKNAGFTVELNSYAEELGANDIKKYALKKGEIIFVCHKQF